MKKLFNLFAICILSVLLFGCDKKVDLKKTYDIELESNPTTGYTWSYSMSKEGIVKFTKDEYILPENSEEVVGAPGKQLYQVTGAKEGEVEITFTYKREWEDTSLDASGYTYKFKVDKNLNIELIDKAEWIS